MTLEQILARMREVRDGINAFAQGLEGRAMTADEQAQWDWFNAEFDHLRSEKEKREAVEARRSEIGAIVLGAPNQRRRTLVTERGDGSRQELDRDPIGDPRDTDAFRGEDPWDLAEVRTYGREPEEVGAELRARAYRAIELMPGTNQRRREVATRMIETQDDDAGTLARHVLYTSSATYLRGWRKAMRGQQAAWTPEEREVIQRAMTLTDAEGGFMVPFQLDPTLILTSDGSVNPFRQISRIETATGDVWHGISTEHATWSWDPESTEVSDDAPAVAQPTIPNHKAQGFIPVTFEAFGDIPNATERIALILARGKDDLEAEAFATGSGTNQPTGIVTALAGTASEINSATTDTFAVGDVYATEEALPARYRQVAVWVANWSIYNDIRQFGTSDGHALFARLGEGMPEGLLGHRKYEASEMDGTINATAHNRIMVFGDFSNYVITDRVGMTVEFVPHLFGTNGRPKGQRGFLAWYRVGADSVNDGAFRMLNVT